MQHANQPQPPYWQPHDHRPGQLPPTNRGPGGLVLGVVIGAVVAGGTCTVCVGLGALSRSGGASTEATSTRADALPAKDDSEARLRDHADKVASFPRRIDEIGGYIKKANALADQNQWESADSQLKTAEVVLDGFKGTSAENDPRWVALSNQVSSARERIQPNADRAEDARRKAQKPDVTPSLPSQNLQQIFDRLECTDGSAFIEVSGFDPCKGSHLVVCKLPARDPSAGGDLTSICTRASSNESPIDYCCPVIPGEK